MHGWDLIKGLERTAEIDACAEVWKLSKAFCGGGDVEREEKVYGWTGSKVEIVDVDVENV